MSRAANHVPTGCKAGGISAREWAVQLRLGYYHSGALAPELRITSDHFARSF